MFDKLPNTLDSLYLIIKSIQTKSLVCRKQAAAQDSVHHLKK